MLRKTMIISALFVSACAHAQSPDAVGSASASQNAAGKTDPGHHSDGLVRIVSAYPLDETVARLEAALAARGIKVMAKIDHGANAAGVDLALPPTTLILFGNPAAGTQLMSSARTAGIDLPMKALVYEKDGAVIYAYNAIDYVADRHSIPGDLPVLAKIESFLAAVAAEATGV